MRVDAPGAVRTAPGCARAVDRIARQRVPDGRQVHPDLVRPTGDQVQLQEGPAGKPLADTVAGRGLAPARHHGHPSPVVWVAPDRSLDASDIGRNRPQGQPQVRLLDGPSLELGHQTGLSNICLLYTSDAADDLLC